MLHWRVFSETLVVVEVLGRVALGVVNVLYRTGLVFCHRHQIAIVCVYAHVRVMACVCRAVYI